MATPCVIDGGEVLPLRRRVVRWKRGGVRATTLIVTFVVVCALFLARQAFLGVGPSFQHHQHQHHAAWSDAAALAVHAAPSSPSSPSWSFSHAAFSSRTLLSLHHGHGGKIERNASCEDFRHSNDTCAFVSEVDDCQPDGGFINYLKLPYCTLSPAAGVVLMVLWLVVLFIALGMTAEEFFCPALSVISDSLRLSHNVAGVTFLALGNGAPDIFSVYSAVTSKKASMALGELFGAGVFVTSVVVGTVSLFVPFKVTRRPFIRDVIIYILAATWAMVILIDGKINLGEAIGFVCLYAAYVLVVVVGRKIYQSRKTTRGVDPVEEKRDRARDRELIDSPTAKQFPRPPPLNVSDADADDEDDGDDVPMLDGTQAHINGGSGPGSDAGSTGARPGGWVAGGDVPHSGDRPARQSLSLPLDVYRQRAGSRGSVSSGSAPPSPRLHPKGHSLRIALNEVDHIAAIPGFSAQIRSTADDETDVSYDSGTESTTLLPTVQLEEVNPWSQLWEALNPIDMEEFRETQWYWKIYAIFSAPVNILLTITTPVVDFDEEDQKWKRYLALLQCIIAPVFFVFGAGLGLSDIGGVFPAWALALCLGIFFFAMVWATTFNDRPPKFHTAFAYMGFIVAVIWIYIVANEIVNLLQTIGRVIGIGDAILGLTVLAWGNSIGDFVSNLTVARQGFPQMAVGACFGGPALNMLLGIGVSCTAECLKRNTYIIHGEASQLFQLKVSGSFLLLSLITTAIWIPVNRFSSSRIHGFALLALYIVFMVTSVVLEFVHPVK